MAPVPPPCSRTVLHKKLLSSTCSGCCKKEKSGNYFAIFVILNVFSSFTFFAKNFSSLSFLVSKIFAVEEACATKKKTWIFAS